MILVTGGTGLAGTHLLYELTASDKKVRAIKRDSSDLDLVQRIFNYYGDDGSRFNSIDWVSADITRADTLAEAMQGCDLVYHCAALVSFDPRDTDKLYKLNVEGTANVVNACLAAGVKRLCHVSSTAATGATDDGSLITEDHPWTNKNNSYYSVSKYRAEEEIYRGIEEGLDAVIVNPCVIFGPGDWSRSSLVMFKQMKRGVSMYATGGNAVVDARDLAAALTALMEKGATGERYLVIGENITFKDLMTHVANAMGKKPPKRPVKAWMLGLVWRLLKLVTWFSGGTPAVSKESAASSMQTNKFSSEKVKRTIDISFRSANQAVQNVVRFEQNPEAGVQEPGT